MISRRQLCLEPQPLWSSEGLQFAAKQFEPTAMQFQHYCSRIPAITLVFDVPPFSHLKILNQRKPNIWNLNPPRASSGQYTRGLQL
jgi:hypothetical protein